MTDQSEQQDERDDLEPEAVKDLELSEGADEVVGGRLRRSPEGGPAVRAR